MKQRGGFKHTFGLDFLALGKKEVWSQEVGTVEMSH